MATDEVKSLKGTNEILTLNIQSKDKMIEKLEQELKESEESRTQLQHDIEELNEKCINFEEELYESKNIQLDLLE